MRIDENAVGKDLDGDGALGVVEHITEVDRYVGRAADDYGDTFLYQRGFFFANRKHYRGSTSSDIWLYRFDDQTHTRLTDFDGPDAHPMWGPGGESIYYVSEAAGTYNLWRMNPDGSNTDLQADIPRSTSLQMSRLSASVRSTRPGTCRNGLTIR